MRCPGSSIELVSPYSRLYLCSAIGALILTYEFLENEMRRQIWLGYRRGIKCGRFNRYSHKIKSH